MNNKGLMHQFIAVRENIYDHFHGSRGCQTYFINDDGNQDKYAAYYTAMYLLQDTTEALIDHRAKGFSKDPMAAYLEFWGVMQALIIHQDAILELRSVVFDEKDGLSDPSGAWEKLRNFGTSVWDTQ